MIKAKDANCVIAGNKWELCIEAPVLQLAPQVYTAARGYAQCNTGLTSMLYMQHRPALTWVHGLGIP